MGYIFRPVISKGIDLFYDRTTRESTPCSLIRDPDTIRTPGSTTRPTNSAEANRRIQNSSQRHIPTAHDMNELFAGAEEEQQKKFIEKYVIHYSVTTFKFRLKTFYHLSYMLNTNLIYILPDDIIFSIVGLFADTTLIL